MAEPTNGVHAPVEPSRTIEGQREQRKVGVARLKATVLEFSVTTEELLRNTPAEPVKLDLEETPALPPATPRSVATAALNGDSLHGEVGPSSIEDGFAALRVQRAQRKREVEAFKQLTSSSVKNATARLDRKTGS